MLLELALPSKDAPTQDEAKVSVLCDTTKGSNAAERIKIPMSPVHLDPTLATVILFAGYVASGGLLLAAIVQAHKIAGGIKCSRIRSLACNFPTLATSSDPWLKVIGNILAPLIFLLYLAIHLSHDQDRNLDEYFYLLLFGLLPYAIFFLELRKPLESYEDRGLGLTKLIIWINEEII
jgi:hypothetical protein